MSFLSEPITHSSAPGCTKYEGIGKISSFDVQSLNLKRYNFDTLPLGGIVGLDRSKQSLRAAMATLCRIGRACHQYVPKNWDVLLVVLAPKVRKQSVSNTRGGEWSFKKFGSRKILANFHRSRSLVFSAVVCVSESRFFDEVVSKSRFFYQQICLGVLFFCLLFAAFDCLCGS